MSIRAKTTLFVLLTFAITVGLLAALQVRSSLARFSEIETELAVGDANRVVRQFDAFLADLAGTNADWAYWDDTYRFVKDGNDGLPGHECLRRGVLAHRSGPRRVRRRVRHPGACRVVHGRRQGARGSRPPARQHRARYRRVRRLPRRPDGPAHRDRSTPVGGPSWSRPAPSCARTRPDRRRASC